jgi:hypothetical protein
MKLKDLKVGDEFRFKQEQDMGYDVTYTVQTYQRNNTSTNIVVCKDPRNVFGSSVEWKGIPSDKDVILVNKKPQLKTETVYQFVYNAGTNPGQLRTAYVTDVCDDLITTIDFNKDAVRNFKISKMSDVVEVPTFTVPLKCFNTRPVVDSKFQTKELSDTLVIYNKTQVGFDELKVGDIFEYKSRSYEKIQSAFGKFNAISDDGVAAYFINNEKVNLLKKAK